MATQKPESPLSALEQERLAELIKAFKHQVELVRMSRLEAGKLAYELKPLYVRSGRKGGWTRFLRDECRQKVRTVDDWILDYLRSVGSRKAPETKRPKGNTAKSATFTDSVTPSNNPDTNHREAVSATFVLTIQEKELLMAAVDRLGPAEATRRMYQALVGK